MTLYYSFAQNFEIFLAKTTRIAEITFFHIKITLFYFHHTAAQPGQNP